MHRVLVTGGLGFIGSNLIKLLIKQKYNVINIDKKLVEATLMAADGRVQKFFDKMFSQEKPPKPKARDPFCSDPLKARFRIL